MIPASNRAGARSFHDDRCSNGGKEVCGMDFTKDEIRLTSMCSAAG
jgi:hypothetical protein